MMNRIGYNLNRGDGLDFGKRRRIPLQPFVPEGKPSNYYDRTYRGLGYVTPPPQSESKSSGSSGWVFDISVGLVFKNLFANMTSISQVEQEEDVEPFDTDLWFNNLIFNGRSISNNMNLLPKIR